MVDSPGVPESGIDTHVWRGMPQPFALAWHAATLESDPRARREALFQCHEVVLRTLLAFALADYARGRPDPELSRSTAEDLKRDSPGGHRQVLERILRFLGGREEPSFLPRSQDWFVRPRTTSGTLSDLSRELTDYRNRWAHWEESRSEQELIARLEASLRRLLEGLSWLGDCRLVRVRSQAPSGVMTGASEGEIQVYRGRDLAPPPRHATWRANPPLLNDRIYLVDSSSGRAMDLYPFLQVNRKSRVADERLVLFKRTTEGGDQLLLTAVPGSETTKVPLNPKGSRLTLREWLTSYPGAGRVHEIADLSGILSGAPAGEPADPTGELIDGRFEIIEHLGAGGMGQVYLVEDRKLGGRLALKLMRRELGEDPTQRERFRREMDRNAAVSHPHVLAVWDRSLTADGRPYFTMPFVPGGSLADRVVPGGLPWAQVSTWAAQLLAALSALHERGIVHRDLKPHNVLVDGDGAAVLADFGVAHWEGAAPITQALELPGTREYAAPEQLRQRMSSPASDVYALGLVLHELLTGERALGGPGEGLQGPVGDWLRQLGAERPEQRPSAGEALAVLPPSASTVAPGLRAGRRPWAGRLWLTLLLAVLAVAGGLLLLRAFSREATEPTSAPASAPAAPTVASPSFASAPAATLGPRCQEAWDSVRLAIDAWNRDDRDGYFDLYKAQGLRFYGQGCPSRGWIMSCSKRWPPGVHKGPEFASVHPYLDPLCRQESDDEAWLAFPSRRKSGELRHRLLILCRESDRWRVAVDVNEEDWRREPEHRLSASPGICASLPAACADLSPPEDCSSSK